MGREIVIDKFVCLDVEMPNGNGNRVSAVGVSVFENGALTKQLYSLINPETWFQPYVIELIGITPDMVKTAPTFPEFWPTLREVMQGALIVAHGAGNDLKALSGCLRHYRIAHPAEVQYLCTVDACIACYPELPAYSLDRLCERFDIALQHHHALSDSEACGRLLLQCLADGLDPAALVRTFDLDAGHNKRLAVSKKKKKKHTALSPTARIRLELNEQYDTEFWAPESDGPTDDQLRRYVQENSNSDHLMRFLSELPHETEAEDRLHAIILSGRSNFTRLAEGIDAFLPHVKSEATIRLLRPKRFQKRQPELEPRLRRWLAAASPYPVLFALQTLRLNYIKAGNLPAFLEAALEIDLTDPRVCDGAEALLCAALSRNLKRAAPVVQAHADHPLVHDTVLRLLRREDLLPQKRERLTALLVTQSEEQNKAAAITLM